MSEGKIVNLRGQELPEPGEVVPEVVAIAENLLEMARSGEVQGVLYVALHADEQTTAERGGCYTRGMLGLLEIVKQRMIEVLS